VARLPNPKPVLEPVIVRGKGRPKGSKGNGKNDGVTGMSRYDKSSILQY
jgi:hypothetical protein